MTTTTQSAFNLVWLAALQLLATAAVFGKTRPQAQTLADSRADAAVKLATDSATPLHPHCFRAIARNKDDDVAARGSTDVRRGGPGWGLERAGSPGSKERQVRTCASAPRYRLVVVLILT